MSDDMTIDEVASRLGTDVDGARAILEYWQGDVNYSLSREHMFATLDSFPREIAERVIAKHLRQALPG
jgi:hypothetical protein